MVTVPDRCPPVLDATVRTTTPPPEPEAPDLTVTHGTLLTAVQEQPTGALTDTLILPPTSLGEANVGPIEYEQLNPDWLILNVCPPTVMVPARAPPVVGATA
jgi:hypothetical protein